MSLAQVFPGIDDFLVLTAKGLIGRFEPEDGFTVFKRLSESVSEYSERLLDAYERDPDSAEFRPAIILPPLPGRKWKSATLVFDQRVLFRLFPSGTGGDALSLTPFQLRNRERSIYQGMELLISYENKSMPGVAFYCPVLFGQGLKLKDYPDYAEALGTDVSRETPVIEVINYIALLGPGDRKRDWARELVRLVNDISIVQSRRADSPFKIQE